MVMLFIVKILIFWGESMKKNICILLVLALLLISIWYHIPSNINKTINCFTIDGKQTLVVLNLSWHKYFFSPTELRGTININGDIYRSISDTNISTYIGNFGDKFKMKIESKKIIAPYIKETGSSLYNINDKIILSINDIHIDKVSLYMTNNNALYYGPANSIDEAVAISLNFYKN